jgi:hypothetical protein
MTYREWVLGDSSLRWNLLTLPTTTLVIPAKAGTFLLSPLQHLSFQRKLEPSYSPHYNTCHASESWNLLTLPTTKLVIPAKALTTCHSSESWNHLSFQRKLEPPNAMFMLPGAVFHLDGLPVIDP